jgi:uncharacterized protein (DUF2141 family)
MFRLTAVMLLLAAHCAVLHAADLDIEVRGIRLRTGQVRAALFENAEDFAIDLTFLAMISPEGILNTSVVTREGGMPRPPTETATAPANARSVHLQMFDLQPGTYSVAVYHDVNGDGKLDTTLDGNPLEPWGLSNNPPANGKPPAWDETRFVLPSEGARLIINLR